MKVSGRKTMRCEPASELGDNSGALLDFVRETKDPVALRHRGKNVAVVVDIDSYQSLVDELELLRDVQAGLADVKAGRVKPHDEVRQLFLARYPG